jgi:gliding motility-associated-like protein
MDIYSVSLAVANDFNCTDTIIKPVTVTFDRLFPPNAFSPNASLAEDQEFRIYGDGVLDEGYQLLIFNRWGEIIFESRSQNEGWDGKMKNADFAPSGVYTWVIEYTDFTGEKHKQQGLVTLLF